MSLKSTILIGALAAAGFVSAVSASSTAEGQLRVRLDANELLVVGEQYYVEVELAAVGGEVELEGWQLTPSILEVDGKAFAPRSEHHKLLLAQNDSIQLRFDLGSRVERSSDFALGCAGYTGNPVDVLVLEPAPKELDFMQVPVEDLAKYRVYMRTNQGDMLHEMWPHLAPNHVRNFLDLSHTGFYDGTTFHRVMPGFMIQGGDPTGTGSGSGPRQLKAEFSKEAHVRGVLSMARGEDPNSATCQFFVMHGSSPGLDGKYSIFGKLLVGYGALDAIVNSPGKYLSQHRDVSPTEPQVIDRAVVVLANTEKK